MEGEWSCYGGGQFKRGRMLMLRRWQVRKGRMTMLERWSVEWRENGHVTEVITLMERKWSGYRGGQFI